MPLQSIVVVFLRISVIQLLPFALMTLPLVTMKNWPTGAVYLCYPILAILIWAFAESISGLVTRGHDATVPLGGLTRLDLYAFAFVYLGLSFFINGIGLALVELAMILGNTLTHPAAHEALYIQSVQQIVRPFIQVLLGIICLVNANRFAKKLAAREQ